MSTVTESRIAALHRLHVARLMAKGVAPCEECGTGMTEGTGFDGAPSRGIDVFVPVAADGSTSAPCSDLLPLFDPALNRLGASDPFQYLNRLAEEQEEAQKACKGRYQGGPRAELTRLYWASAQEYTALLVRLDTGPTYHHHRPAPLAREVAPSVPPLPLPRHCGWPAWLRPSGFYCRECGELLTDATAEYEAPPAPVSMRVIPLCEVCSGREGTTEVAQFGGRLVCEPCIEEAQSLGILPASA